jgi:hypothetical protein
MQVCYSQSLIYEMNHSQSVKNNHVMYRFPAVWLFLSSLHERHFIYPSKIKFLLNNILFRRNSKYELNFYINSV